MAVRLRLELRNRLSPVDGLAIRSNTIIGPHLHMAGAGGVEPHPPLQQNLVFKASRGTIPTASTPIILYLVQPVGIEPTSTVLQTVAMTTSAKVALGRRMRIELMISESQPEVLPLN